MEVLDELLDEPEVELAALLGLLGLGEVSAPQAVLTAELSTTVISPEATTVGALSAVEMAGAITAMQP